MQLEDSPKVSQSIEKPRQDCPSFGSLPDEEESPIEPIPAFKHKISHNPTPPRQARQAELKIAHPARTAKNKLHRVTDVVQDPVDLIHQAENPLQPHVNVFQ